MTKITKVIELMKSKLGRKIMTEFFALRLEIYSYLTEVYDDSKKAKDTKNFVINENLNVNIKNIVYYIIIKIININIKITVKT